MERAVKRAYLDTGVAVWLAQGDLNRIPQSAQDAIRNCKLLVSPMVSLELAYLNEVNRITVNSEDILLKLKAELGVEVCDASFSSLIAVAVNERWTRDPFDRIIVSHAKANGLSPAAS